MKLVVPTVKQVVDPRLGTYTDRLKDGWGKLYSLIGYEGRANWLTQAVQNNSAFIHTDRKGQPDAVITAAPFTFNGLNLKNTWYVGNNASKKGVDPTVTMKLIVNMITAARKEGITHVAMLKKDDGAKQLNRLFGGLQTLSPEFVSARLDTTPWLKSLDSAKHDVVATHLYNLTRRYNPDNNNPLGYHWFTLPVPSETHPIVERYSKLA